MALLDVLHLAAAAAHDDDWHFRQLGRLPELGAHVIARKVRQDIIEQDKIRPLRLGAGAPLGPALGGDDLEVGPVLGEHVGRKAQQHQAVVDDEKFLSHDDVSWSRGQWPLVHRTGEPLQSAAPASLEK